MKETAELTSVRGFTSEAIQQQLSQMADSLDFDVEAHRYIVKKTGQECISVSTLIESLTPVFEGSRIATAMSLRDGIPQDEILEDWRIRRDYSIVKGTEFHLYAKTFIETARKRPLQTPIEKQVRAFHEFWQRNTTRFSLVASEFMVFDEDLGLAGTVDGLFLHKETQNLFIFDWKTNREIRKNDPYHKKLLPPLEASDACEFTKYSLQMTLYRMLIAKKLDLVVGRAFLIHFNAQGAYHVIETDDFSQHLPVLQECARTLSKKCNECQETSS